MRKNKSNDSRLNTQFVFIQLNCLIGNSRCMTHVLVTMNQIVVSLLLSNASSRRATLKSVKAKANKIHIECHP